MEIPSQGMTFSEIDEFRTPVENHHDDQNNGVDQHTVRIKSAEQLRKQRQDHRRNHGTADISDSAQHNEYKNHDGLIVSEVLLCRRQRR